MGRPRKQIVDYFPHFVTSSRTKEILQDKWGNDGYAVWFKLLELLGRSNGHYYDCTKMVDWEYLVSFMKVSEEKVTSIIIMLVEMEKFDKDLWEQHKIIWCQQFVDYLQEVYSKRKMSIPIKPFSQETTDKKLLETEIKQAEIRETKPLQKFSKNDENLGQSNKSNKRKKTEIQKVKYGEFVHMSQEDYGKLVETYGEEKAQKMIEVLDNYKGSTGKSYKNDYRAILSWVVDKVNEEHSKKGGKNEYGTQRAARYSGDFKPSRGFKGNR